MKEDRGPTRIIFYTTVSPQKGYSLTPSFSTWPIPMELFEMVTMRTMRNDAVAQRVFLSTQDQETVAVELHKMEVEILLGANSKAPEEGTNLITLGNKTHGVIHVAGDWMFERLI